MLTLILTLLAAAANVSTPSPLLALSQATAVAVLPSEAPKSQRFCHDIPVSNSRFMRRVCTTVVKQPTEAELRSLAPPVPSTLGVAMSVVDSHGGAVGTIIAVAADAVTIKTDKYQAQLPKTSFTINEGKALFGLTQTELNASIEKTISTMPQPELKVGASVNGTAGSSVGTIQGVGADTITIKLVNGSLVSIARSGIAAQADGSAVIGWTAAELEAHVKAAQPGS